MFVKSLTFGEERLGFTMFVKSLTFGEERLGFTMFKLNQWWKCLLKLSVMKHC